MTETQRLYALGGKVGSRLTGTDEQGTDVIEITAIGRDNFMAIKVMKDGKIWQEGRETNWTLTLRDWKLIEELKKE